VPKMETKSSRRNRETLVNHHKIDVQRGIPPKATLIGSLCPPPKVSRALANAMSPS